MCLPFFYNNLNFIDIGEALAMQFHVHEIFCKKKKRMGGGSTYERSGLLIVKHAH